MSRLAALDSTHSADGAASELQEARESLAYWEDRSRGLPRHAVRRRREARELADRWTARVAEAERETYGRGVIGALSLLAAEGRVPEPTRQVSRRVVRRATQIGMVVIVAVVVMILGGLLAGLALLAAFLDGLL